jgi:hypothetical protein
MANTYNWEINKLDVRTHEDGMDNIVYNIHWGYTAISDQKDAEGNNYSARLIGTQIITGADPGDFIAFENLKESDIISWLEGSSLDIEKLKKTLNKKIKELIAPTFASKDVPW